MSIHFKVNVLNFTWTVVEMAGITAQMIAFHATIRHIMINSSLRGNISQFQVERAKRESSKRNVPFPVVERLFTLTKFGKFVKRRFYISPTIPLLLHSNVQSLHCLALWTSRQFFPDFSSFLLVLRFGLLV